MANMVHRIIQKLRFPLEDTLSDLKDLASGLSKD